MLISKAYAQSVEVADGAAQAMAEAPDATAAFAWNMGLVLVLVVLFYVLLIAPQQRRFKEHSKMLSELKKGDRVVTGGGLIGKIEKVLPDNEVIVDLGNSVKVTALLSTLQGKNAPAAPANDAKADDKKDAKKASKKAK
jgi:preprotein translocase subunit YajC